MGNDFFKFKQFTVFHRHATLKVTTDACLFGAWTSEYLHGTSGRLLDVGTGTGLLSLMIAQQFAGNIIALDIDENSVKEAEHNFNASPWKQRIVAKHLALQDFRSDRLFDIIVSNPPFFHNDLKSPSESRNLALHAGALGIKELVHHSSALLNPKGTLFAMVAHRRRNDVEMAVRYFGFHCVKYAEVRHSHAHQPIRIMYVLTNTLSDKRVEAESIAVRAADGQYSNRFVELLKPYYLHL